MPRSHRASSRRSDSHRRRGSVVVAIIVALVMLQVVVMGVVVLGASDQSLTTLRLEASKAQYAAESGMNMALKEIYDGSDLDGDGGIGSISDEGNSGNDPAVNGASVVVSMSVSGGTTTLTSTARTANAKRSIVVTLN